MLLIKVLVRPCSERLLRSSSGRLTSRAPSSPRSTVIGAATVWLRLPLGPLTVTVGVVVPSIWTSTPDGTVIGSLPMRDIATSLLLGLWSPDVGEDFPAHPLLVGLTVGQEALAGRDDRDAQATEHLGQARVLRVHPQAGLADAADAGDGALPGSPVLERDGERLRDAALGVLGDVVRRDVALGLENVGDAGLQLAVGHRHRVVVRLVGVAQPGQHVCDRIGHRHGGVVLSRCGFPGSRSTGPAAFVWSGRRDYQLDFVMPGSSPRWAISRRQIRHRPNL